MNIEEEIARLENVISRSEDSIRCLKEANKIYNHLTIYRVDNVMYLCSQEVIPTSNTVEIITTPSHLSCHAHIYKEHLVTDSAGSNYKFRVYGQPFQINIFDTHSDVLECRNYQITLSAHGAQESIKKQIDSFIISFVTDNKFKINKSKFPPNLLKFLPFI